VSDHRGTGRGPAADRRAYLDLSAPEQESARDSTLLADELRAAPLLGVIRTHEIGAAGEIARAFVGGGLRVLEVSLTVPEAFACIAAISQNLSGGAILGAGTVQSAEEASAAVAAGARFLVTPTVSESVLEFGASTGVPIICGALTPTEIRTALDLGADLVKIFPGGSMGPGYVRELRGPFPHVRLVPTGGIQISDIGAFRSAGAFAIGMGGSLTPADAVTRRAWPEISRTVAKALAQWRAEDTT
jgi:2-dehydro-3-deoxyphosphogluconate aldolase / (4S)-4-hydroxy-2-oxoglutarate aldolase